MEYKRRKSTPKLREQLRDPCTAWLWLYNHPMCARVDKYGEWSEFRRCLDVEYVRVNPKNLTIEDDDKLNTKTQCWLEFGGCVPASWPGAKDTDTDFIHDSKLDTGGDTFEKALVKLAALVLKHYGDYKWAFDYCVQK